MTEPKAHQFEPVRTSLVDWPETVERVVICIGAQKAATSFLYSSLKRDDRVSVPPIKEVHYWDTFGGPEPRRFRRRARKALMSSWSRRDLDIAILRHVGSWGHKRYREFLLRDYAGQPVVFEATPAYALCNQKTLRDIGNIAPETRLVLVMRDPVERMWSAAKYIWRKRIAAGLAGETEMIDFFLDRVTHDDRIDYRHSAYDRTIRTLEAVGHGDKLSVLFQETLSEAPERASLAAALGFETDLNYEKRYNTHGHHFPLPQDAHATAKAAFADTYAFVRERFGDRVPEAWHA